MAEQDPENLARRAVEGDRAALEALVGAISDDVYRLAMRMLGHPADAEDACQEMLIKVVTHLGSFRGESGLRTWVWKVATNHLASVRRSRREPRTSADAPLSCSGRRPGEVRRPGPITPVATLLLPRCYRSEAVPSRARAAR